MLIEVERDVALVGIGCNVLTSPEVQKVGDNGGRDAGCIAEFISLDDSTTEKGDTSEVSSAIQYRNLLANVIFDKTRSWLSLQVSDEDYDTAEKVIADCGFKMNFGSVQRLRWDRYSGVGRSGELEEVIPLRLNHDGTLLVGNKVDYMYEALFCANNFCMWNFISIRREICQVV